MNREEAQAQLERYFDRADGALSAGEMRAAVAAYPELAEELALWDAMGAVPVEEPGPGLSLRLAEMLETFREERLLETVAPPLRQASWIDRLLERLWPSEPAYGFAAAMMLLLVGLAGGWVLGSRGAGGDELVAMRKELKDTRELAVLTMLQQQSAEERLRAVSYSAELKRPAGVIINALIRTLRYDTSVDVRLAALDALAAHRDQVEVRRAFVEAVKDDSSPLLQVQLVGELARIADAQAIQALETLAVSPTANKAVRMAAADSLRASL